MRLTKAGKAILTTTLVMSFFVLVIAWAASTDNRPIFTPSAPTTQEIQNRRAYLEHMAVRCTMLEYKRAADMTIADAKMLEECKILFR